MENIYTIYYRQGTEFSNMQIMYKALTNGWQKGRKKRPTKIERHEQAVDWKQISMANKLICAIHLEKVPVKTMIKYHFCLPHCQV